MKSRTAFMIPIYLTTALTAFIRPEISLAASPVHPITCQRIYAEAGGAPISMLFPDLIGPELRSALAAKAKLEKEMSTFAPQLKAAIAADSRMTVGQMRKQVELLMQRQKDLQAELGKLESRIYDLQQASREHVMARLSETLKEPIAAQTFQNYMKLLELTHVNSKSVVSLLAGHRGQVYDHSQMAQVLEVARGLVDRGYTVVFDGDSPTAAALAAVLGSRGIRVTGDSLQKPSHGETILHIENAYLRLMAFSHAEKLVTTPDSPTGLAVVINTKTSQKNPPKRFILDPKNQWQSDLARFHRDIEKRKPDLGIQYETDVFRFSDATGLLSASYDKGGNKPAFTTVEAPSQIQSLTWKDLSVDELITVTEAAASMQAGSAALKDVGGAVIFGSAKVDPHSAKLVYNIAKHLSRSGIAVRTGGSGGAMLIANMGAFDGGAPSIGIPIIGKQKVVNEYSFPTEVHTQTLGTPDYTVRIPLLIEGVQLVGFVPGGMGTMKELAAVLVAMQSDASFKPKLVFAQMGYYDSLVKLLQKDFIPAFVRDQVSHIEEATELDPMIHDISGPQPKTRNERNEFPLPKQ